MKLQSRTWRKRFICILFKCVIKTAIGWPNLVTSDQVIKCDIGRYQSTANRLEHHKPQYEDDKPQYEDDKPQYEDDKTHLDTPT